MSEIDKISYQECAPGYILISGEHIVLRWYQSDAGQWMKKQMGEHFADDKNLSDEQVYQQIKTAYKPILERAAFVSGQLQKQKPLLVIRDIAKREAYLTRLS